VNQAGWSPTPDSASPGGRTVTVAPARPASQRLRTTFAALRFPNYRLWASADIISVTGSWMQTFAVSWYVLEATGSAANMGLTILFQALPSLLLSIVGGGLADRLPARPLLVVTQLLHALLAVALAAIAWSPQPHVALVYMIAAAGGLISAVEGPVLGRFSSTMVDAATLPNAVALGSVISSAGRILGMASAGVLVAVAGTGPVFIANAVSFLAVIAVLMLIRTDRLHALTDGAAVVRAGIRAGLRFAASQPLLLLTLGLALVLGSLGRNYQVTMGAMSAGPLQGGATGYGVLSTAFAIGTVLGGLLAASRSGLSLRTLVGLGLLTSVLQTVAGLAPSVVTLAAVIVPIAAGAVMIDTTVTTRVQLDSPGALRGRVLGLTAAVSGASGALGAPLLGHLCEQIGPRATLVVAGAATALACVAGGLALARHRGLKVRPYELVSTLRETLGLPERSATPTPVST
jgi:MFS family permease